MEDLLRACQLDDERIEQLLVNRFATMTDDLSSVRQWYLELRDMMLGEGRREHGHLQINTNVLNQLTDLHQQLLKEGQDAIYTSCFYSTLPFIVELRGKEGEQKVGELETCFTALYGVMLMRMQKREISKETGVAIKQISKFMGLLAEKYRCWRNGELKLGSETL